MSNPAASRSTVRASRSTVGASHPTKAASCSNQEASRFSQTASRFNHAAPSSNREASRFRQHTNWTIYEDFPPSSPPQEAPHSRHPTNRVFDDLPPSSPTPSSQFSSPPPISRPSTPVPTSDYSHLRDAIYPSRSRYEGSRNEALQHQHAYNDVMPTHNPDIRKRTWPHYESARETEDLERETVEERHRARVHDNSHIRSGRAVSTSRSRLPARSSVVPTSRAGPSQRRHYPTARSPRIRPASPTRRSIIEEDELTTSTTTTISCLHQPYEMIEGTMYLGTQMPEDKPSGWMDVDVNVSFDIDGDVIMEILQPVDKLERCMDVITPEPEDGLVGRMDVDVDFSFDMDGDAIMEILQPDDELEWLKDVDGDIVMHESMAIEQAA
ncbi:hypothetical protein F4604DRAFT_1916718 [Suillus subluteus]|nr:hypothetical protein F4604DRAFT_1916718 [Suillus subluteus]